MINIQNNALRKLMNHAFKNVKFYRDLYSSYGLQPDDIKSIEDITKLPIVDKKMMAMNPLDNLISENYEKRSLIPIKTAGSNGMPFLFYIDQSFDQFRKAQFLRPYITNRRLPWFNSVLFSVHNAPVKKWYQHLGFMKDHYVHSGSAFKDQIKIIQKTRPSVIQGYGSVLNLLSAYVIENNILIPAPRLVFTDSELLTPDMRANIEAAFNTKVTDIYGTYETDNIAYECNFHEGYHMAIDSVIMEFAVDGKIIKPGEKGEIVVTILNNFAMPFIRYNLHDSGSYGKKPCTCGRTFPLMDQIEGRSNDYMITGDGKKLSFFNIAYFDKLAPNVREYQIVQEEINFFNIYIVPGSNYKNHAENIIKPAIKKFFPAAEVSINIVNEIDREPSGKFKAFKSKVNIL